VIVGEDFMLEKGGPFFVDRCAGCGLRFQACPPPPETLRAHYPDSYGPYAPAVMRPGRAVQWRLRHGLGYAHLDAMPSPGLLRKAWGSFAADTQLFPAFVPGGKLLEIGCASGNRLAMLRDLGWNDCRGIEFGEIPAQRARERGFPVDTGRVEDALSGIPDGSLDVVIASFVLEHLEDPFEITRRIAGKLKPGGQFLFSTVDVGGPDFHWFGKYWYSLDLPRHLVFFRKKDILKMLEGAFRVKAIRHKPSADDYLVSARYRSRREQRLADRLLLSLGNRIFPLCVLLARLDWASRITVRCTRIVSGDRGA
jgi:2-polyprenyl-3-methyl-5-hydroxy-6-metoxy-1,4-benzoquinol methylase